jgi:Mg2+ and Co2+ transporter CorA
MLENGKCDYDMPIESCMAVGRMAVQLEKAGVARHISIDEARKLIDTLEKMRFIYEMMFRSAMLYQAYLRGIDKKRTEIEERVGDDTHDTDIIELHELESTLVYFATSLTILL